MNQAQPKQPSEILDRKPPSDEAAEHAILGSLLVDPRCWSKIGKLTPAEFYSWPLAAIAKAAWRLHGERVTPDHVTLLAAMKGEIAPAGTTWAAILATCIDQGMVVNFEHYVRAVRVAAVKRAAINSACELLQGVYSDQADPDAIINRMNATADSLHESLTEGLAETTLRQAAFDSIERIAANSNPLIQLGLPDLDNALGGGVELGEIVIFGARSSHGKSAVALQALHNVTAQGLPALYVSLEMSELSLGKRAIQYATSTPMEHWHFSLKTIIADVSEHFHGREEVYIVESTDNCGQVCRTIREYVKTHGVKVVVVDYAQLVQNVGRTRYEQMTNTSIAMRQIASECKVVLLLLCQLNREIEKREAFVPKISDIRDTGQFEQDADAIVFMVWPHRIDKSKDPKEFLFFVAKNRNRAIVTPAFKCVFEPSRQMFTREIPQAEPWSADEREF